MGLKDENTWVIFILFQKIIIFYFEIFITRFHVELNPYSLQLLMYVDNFPFLKDIFYIFLLTMLTSVYLKNFHDSSDICPMGFMYSIQIHEISHRTFGLSHWKCPTCPMIFVNTVTCFINREIFPKSFLNFDRPAQWLRWCVNDVQQVQRYHFV